MYIVLRVKTFKSFFCGCSVAVSVLSRVGLLMCSFYLREHPKAQPTVVLVLKHLKRQDHGLKVSSNRLGEP